MKTITCKLAKRILIQKVAFLDSKDAHLLKGWGQIKRSTGAAEESLLRCPSAFNLRPAKRSVTQHALVRETMLEKTCAKKWMIAQCHGEVRRSSFSTLKSRALCYLSGGSVVVGSIYPKIEKGNKLRRYDAKDFGF